MVGLSGCGYQATLQRTFSRYAKKRKNWTMQHPPGRTFGAIAVVADLLLMACGRAVAADGPPGITRPVVLPPFNAAAPNPPGLQRVLAFAQDNQRKFMQGIASGPLGRRATTKKQENPSVCD
jgi:hypothetical protein